MSRTIVDSIKESFSVPQSSTGNGTMRQKARTIYRAGFKMETLKAESKKAIGKVSKRLELRKATVSNVLESFEASPDPSSWLSDFNVRTQRKDKLDDTIGKFGIRKAGHG